MEIRVAKTAGFCFGVNRAVELTYGLLAEGHRVATLGPLDIRHPDDEHFRQTGGHFALDEQRHRTHGARHHQQNVVIHRLQCRTERKAVYPGLAQHNKEHRTAQCHPRAVLLQPQHQQVGGCKHKQRKCHSRFSLLRVSLSSSIMR